MTILELMVGHHRQCDDAFAKVENLVAGNDWSNPAAFDEFFAIMTKHFKAEEDVLFVAIEKKMGGPIGPTQVMRQEHQQMSVLMERMKDAFAAKDQKTFLSASDTWMIIAQQHNMKEEEILYPMMDEALRENATAVIAKTREFLY